MAPHRQQGGFPASLGLILLVAAGLRVCYLAMYAGLPEWTMLTVDNCFHHHWAQDIAAGNILGATTYFRAPFYVFVLAALYAVFGVSLWTARVFGLAVGLASVALTYVLGRRAVSSRVGLLAAGLHAVWPTALYFESELLLDPLFLLLLQASVWRLLVWRETHRARDAFWLGLALGLAAITRPTALLLLVVVAGVALCARRGLAPLLRTALAVGLGLAIAIGPIFIRNLAVAGDPVLIASQGGINLYIGNNPEADGVSAVLPEPLGFNWQIRDVVHIAEQAAGRPLAPGEVSDYWAQRARTWIAAHPLSFLRLYAEKLYWNISHREISNNRALGPFFALIPLLRYNPLSFGLLFALALAGLAAALRTNARLRLIALILLLYVAASALFFFNSRFRLPVLPLYFILAATGVFGLAEAVRRRRGLVLPAAALTVGAGLSFLPLVSLPSGVSPQAIMSAANYAYGQGDFRRALELSAEAAAVDSTYPEVNLNLGNAWLRLGDAAAARAAWEREARFHPGRPKALTNLASLALLEGRFADAQAEGQRALALRPYDYDANLVWLRAVFAADTTAPEQLVAEVQAAAARTGGDVYLLNEAGILLTQRGLAETARATLLAALSAPPPPIEMDDAAFAPNFRHSRERMREQHAQAAYQLGYLAALASRFGEAVEFSRRAVELDPGLAEAWVNLVGACAAAGRIDEARTTLREALARFPNRPELRELDRRLAPRQ